ncbi:MAG: TetR/AcrR family transcriptional regulator [Alphaproteobacteria bacterium]|nr:TetR/AcrR family transcriptional regulator [Alphaproteobacteria bacterium]
MARRAVSAGRGPAARDRLAPGRVADAALALAETTGWYELRMRDLARRLGVGLDALAARYRDPDAIADIVFARARDAMLAAPPPGEAGPRARAERAMLRWFDALAPHRRIAVEMLQAKLHPSHPHHWAPLPFHLSRLIWWLREAAALDAAGARRQAEEIALSGVFLAVLAAWGCDASEGQRLSRALLARLLDRAERAFGWWRADGESIRA